MSVLLLTFCRKFGGLKHFTRILKKRAFMLSLSSKLCGPVPKYEFRVEVGIFEMKGGNEGGIMPNRLIRH